ncbi:MAG: hypothetical protein ACU84Q_00365 [Gammaproteobacteria bacterium]
MAVELDDITHDYIPIAEARKMSGLRVVLGAYPIPGPWRESCKGILHVKGLKYACVQSSDAGASDLAIGMENSQSELIAWTGQSSAPVIAYNDELPRSKWYDQLLLAERLAPKPSLIPKEIEDRIRMYGLSNELLGENGLVWKKRHLMVHQPLQSLPADDEQRGFWIFLGEKYGYSPEAADRAGHEIAEILGVLNEQLANQKALGSQFLIGHQLSALDIYWAASCGLLAPMEEARCPMYDGFRGPYGNDHPAIEKALSDELIAHRDFIYQQYLELPIVF